MVRSAQPDNASDPTATIAPIAADVEPAAARGNATPASRPEPSPEELERLRRKLIAKFH